MMTLQGTGGCAASAGGFAEGAGGFAESAAASLNAVSYAGEFYADRAGKRTHTPDQRGEARNRGTKSTADSVGNRMANAEELARILARLGPLES